MNPYERAVPIPLLLIAVAAMVSHSGRASIVLLLLLAAGSFAWWVNAGGQRP